LIIIAKLSILVLMLFLIHNIHIGLNLNNLNILEQNYNLINIDYSNNLENIKDINYLYINKDIPFSF